jgi:type IV pilus assembly protein PilW
MQAMNRQTKGYSKNGFTLVELMVAVALTGIAVIAIYRGYTSFSQTADAQEQIIEMQQNLRIGMFWLVRDLRRAGMDNENDNNAGFIVADSTTVRFSMDIGGDDPLTGLQPTSWALTGTWNVAMTAGDGDVDDLGERISYARLPNADGGFSLYRNDENQNPGDKGDEIITNLEALNFAYFSESGTNLNLFPLSAADRELIRLVEVSMVVRTTNEDYRYTNNETYFNLQDDPILTVSPADNFRRRILASQIKIRNQGL